MTFYIYAGVSRKRRPQHARRKHISGSGGRTVCAYQPTYVEHLYVTEIRLDRLPLLRNKIQSVPHTTVWPRCGIRYGFIAHIMEFTCFIFLLKIIKTFLPLPMKNNMK